MFFQIGQYNQMIYVELPLTVTICLVFLVNDLWKCNRLCKTDATKRNKTTQQNAKRKKLYKIKTKEMELMLIKINEERRKFLQIIR
jgi:hypothetical protein